MLTARRSRERQAAEVALAASKRPPSLPLPPQLTEAEILQERFRAKQEAARQPRAQEQATPVAAPVAVAAPIAPTEKPEPKEQPRSGSAPKSSK